MTCPHSHPTQRHTADCRENIERAVGSAPKSGDGDAGEAMQAEAPKPVPEVQQNVLTKCGVKLGWLLGRLRLPRGLRSIKGAGEHALDVSTARHTTHTIPFAAAIGGVLIVLKQRTGGSGKITEEEVTNKIKAEGHNWLVHQILSQHITVETAKEHGTQCMRLFAILKDGGWVGGAVPLCHARRSRNTLPLAAQCPRRWVR